MTAFSSSILSIIPTAAGINITGIRSRSRFHVTSTSESLMIPLHRPPRRMNRPYTPAGTGSGMNLFKSSPTIVIPKMITIIAYASPPRLRSRLTLRRRSLLRNPRAFGGKDSTEFFLNWSIFLYILMFMILETKSFYSLRYRITPHCVLWQSAKHSTARNQYGIPVNDFRKFSGFFRRIFL